MTDVAWSSEGATGAETTPDHPVPWWRSIRWRLSITFALLAAILIGTFGLFASRAVLDSAREQERTIAADDLMAATASYRFTGVVPANVSLGKSAVPAIVERALRPGTMVSWDDGTRLWVAHQLEDGRVLSARYPDAPVLQRWRSLRAHILWLAVLVAVLASLAGLIWASSLTRRLRAVAQVARRIRSGHLGERIPAQGEDELAVLASAINGMTDDLVYRISQERALTADAAHELRTPMTALVSATELLPDTPDSARVRRHVGRMRALIEEILLLARLEAEPTASTLPVVDLATLVGTAVADLPPGIDVDVVVVASRPVRANPTGARRAIANLINNAVRYGRPPITLTVDRNVLVIEDRGPGFPAELLAEGPRRFRPLGPSGNTGLGLTIVSRELRTMGAGLTLRNSDVGSVSTITFATEDALTS